MVALDLGREVSGIVWQDERVGYGYHDDGFVCEDRLRVGDEEER